MGKEKTNDSMKPTHYELTITFKTTDKEKYQKLVGWLIEHESFSFYWEWHMREIDEEINLTISGCWADTLNEIFKILPDYDCDG